MFDAVALTTRESDVVAIIEGFLHDFKTPLMNLKIARSVGDNEAVDASINTIDSFLQNLKIIIQDEKSQIDVLSSISHALKASRYILNAFNKKINIEINNLTGYSQVIVQSRGMSLERILLNLLKNAAEVLAHSETPTLIVETTLVDSRVQIEIRDNGRGISPKLLPYIFNEGVTTKQGTDHGRGLYIVKTMIDRCGGEISVTSKLGEGTSFFITLPVYTCSN